MSDINSLIISFVKEQPAIWDKGNDIYKDKSEKERAWLAVAKSVFSEWDYMETDEKNKKMHSLKTKWKNMKDYMMRSLQKKSGDSAKKKKYVHFEALTFLLTAAEKRRTSDNYDSESSQEEDEILPDDTSDRCDSDSGSTPQSKNLFFKPYKKRVAPHMTSFQKTLVKSLEEATACYKTSQPSEDADRLYLLSLLPDYKNLTPPRKWEFRQYVANFFRNAYISDPVHSYTLQGSSFTQPQIYPINQQPQCSQSSHLSSTTSILSSASTTPSQNSPPLGQIKTEIITIEKCDF